MDNFPHAYRRTLQFEGGWVDDPDDRGGATKYGISLRFLQVVGEDINDDGEVNADDIRAITKVDAVKLYKKYFWDYYRLHNILDRDVAAKCYDMFVNMSGHRAGNAIQKAINLSDHWDVVVDGIVGSKTFSALNARCQENKEQLMEKARAKTW